MAETDTAGRVIFVLEGPGAGVALSKFQTWVAEESPGAASALFIAIREEILHGWEDWETFLMCCRPLFQRGCDLTFLAGNRKIENLLRSLGIRRVRRIHES